MNLLFFPVGVLAALLFLAGYKAGSRSVHWLVYLAASVCALPAVLMAAYYLHLYDDALWFYEFRSLPFSELSAAAAGFPAGLIYAWVAKRSPFLGMSVPGLLLVGLFVPYMKPVIAPLDVERLAAVCKDGVCLQTTASTCGPASAASVLRLFGVEETEKTLAKEAFTSAGGTENWYLARALRRRGFDVRYEILDRPVAKLPYPSIAGVTLPGGGGHFIAVLGETPEAYVVGEPMSGKLVVPKTRIGATYSFTGFFMVVGKRQAHRISSPSLVQETRRMMEKNSAVADAIAIRKLNRQWMEAYTKRNTAFLQRHMSDDYVGTFPDGTVHDKKSEIEAVKSGRIAITEMEPSEMVVRVYDNAAVITGQSSVKARVGGKDMSAELRFTDIWIRQGDRWQAVASQVTRVEQPQRTA